jgi:hypothetical protein
LYDNHNRTDDGNALLDTVPKRATLTRAYPSNGNMNDTKQLQRTHHNIKKAELNQEPRTQPNSKAGFSLPRSSHPRASECRSIRVYVSAKCKSGARIAIKRSSVVSLFYHVVKAMTILKLWSFDCGKRKGSKDTRSRFKPRLKSSKPSGNGTPNERTQREPPGLNTMSPRSKVIIV